MPLLEDSFHQMEGATSSEILLEAAKPDLYRRNAFRITGLQVDASPKDIMRQAERMELADKLGGKIQQPGGALPLDPEPDADAVRDAINGLRDPERRLVDEFFWFWPHNLGQSRTDEALAALSRRDIATAMSLWLKWENYSSEANVSKHNIAVLLHAMALDLEHKAISRGLSKEETSQRETMWKEAYQRWKILLEHEGFWSRLASRIRDLDDPRLTTGTARHLKASLPLALLLINAQLALKAAEREDSAELKRHLEIMANWESPEPKLVPAPPKVKSKEYTCPFCSHTVEKQRNSQFWCTSCLRTVEPTQKVESGLASVRDAAPPTNLKEEALRRVLKPLCDRIKIYCKTADTDSTAEPEKADLTAKHLLDQTLSLLKILDKIFPRGGIIRDGQRDQVAMCALGCQIDYANKTKDWKGSIELLQLVLPFAASQTAKTRIEENLKILQGNFEFQTNYGTCWFCKNDPPDDSAAVDVKMHGNIRREHPQVYWQHITINVPRCKRCKKKHTRNNIITVGGALLGGLLGLGPCVAIAEKNSDNEGIGFLVLLGLIYLGYLIGVLISKLKKKGIRSKSAAHKFPEVEKWRKQGWEFGEKPPNIQ